MEVRFKKKSVVFDVLITAISGIFSVGTMLYAVWHFGLREAWPELVLTLFYIASLVMMFMSTNEYTNYLVTEIWIRPTITYGLVACFVSETENKSDNCLLPQE